MNEYHTTETYYTISLCSSTLYRSRLQDVARIWENGLHWSVRPILPVFPYPGDILQSRTVHTRSVDHLSSRILFRATACSMPSVAKCYQVLLAGWPYCMLCLENGNLTHIGDRQTCFHSLRKTASVWPTAATSMAMGDIGSPNHPLLPTRSPNYMARRRKALIYLFVRKLKLHS